MGLLCTEDKQEKKKTICEEHHRPNTFFICIFCTCSHLTTVSVERCNSSVPPVVLMMYFYFLPRVQTQVLLTSAS